MGEERDAIAAGRAKNRRGQKSLFILSSAATLVGVAALAASVWIYADMRQDALRMATEIAQLRVSLDLYAQRGAAAGGESPDLSAFEARLTALEDAVSKQSMALPPTATGAAAVPSGTAVVPTESDGDCLPSGMRLLVAAGDIYPICGVDAQIEVMTVSNGYITLTDGTTVPSGSAVPLVGTACMIGVTSGGDEAVTGFAEIRVSC